MHTTNKTVLITGGGSGIGFEIARLLSQQGNQVIITGRTEEKLKKATEQLSGVDYIVSDITSETSVQQLVTTLQKNYRKLDLLINNAGAAYAYKAGEQPGDFDRSAAEITTNYLSAIRLIEKLLPLLHQSREAGIVNVTSIVALAASNRLPTYAASKVALHFYTQSLRHALQQSGNIKVFELMPPLVNTEFSKEIGGHNGIPPQQVAEELVQALEQDVYEIHVGQTASFYNAFHANAAAAYQALNGN
jgi:uncharacterized oxidoreductase